MSRLATPRSSSTPAATRLRRPHTRWPITAVLAVGAALLVGLVVLAFLWPTKTMSPHDLPVSVTGPQQSVSALKDRLAGEDATPFALVDATDRDEAIAQIERRDTYGAIVLQPQGAPEVLTAPAASAPAAQLLNGAAKQLEAAAKQQVAERGGDATKVSVKVTEVVPLVSEDASGAGLAAASFPMMLGGMLGGVLVSMLVVGIWRRLAAVAIFAALAGTAITLILHTWFGYLPGEGWHIALAAAASIAGTSTLIVGLTSLLGSPGIGVGAVVTMFFANPISAATTPWQFLAEPWGAIGQLFVPGASNWLLKSVSYFPEADTTKQWLVLAAWIAIGVVLSLLGHFRDRPTMHLAEEFVEPDTETKRASNAAPARGESISDGHAPVESGREDASSAHPRTAKHLA